MGAALKSLEKQIAKKLVNQSLKVKAQDTVTISTGRHTIDMAEEIALECFRVGADVLLNLYTDRYFAGYLNLLSAESLREPSKFCSALTETSSVEVFMGGLTDPAVLRGIPAEKLAASSEGEQRAHWPRRKERKVRVAFLALALTTPERARAYGFGYGPWRKMMYEASAVDYSALTRAGRRIGSILEKARNVHVTAPNGSDITFNLEGRRAFINDGVIDEEDLAKENFDVSIPAGQVSIAPIEISAQGKVAFDQPVLYAGRTVEGLRWSFENGRVKDFRGGRGSQPLLERYGKETGDRDRIASLTIGVNPKAKFGYNLNFVASGAVSIGIGQNEDLGGTNKSPFYLEGTLSRATLLADGKAIVNNGRIAV